MGKWKNGARGLSSTPYTGNIQDLTFNLFSTLADQHRSANALFWITVWITALGCVSGTESCGVNFAAAASRSPNQCELGELVGLGGVGWEGGGVCWGVLAARSWDG